MANAGHTGDPAFNAEQFASMFLYSNDFQEGGPQQFPPTEQSQTVSYATQQAPGSGSFGNTFATDSYDAQLQFPVDPVMQQQFHDVSQISGMDQSFQPSNSTSSFVRPHATPRPRMPVEVDYPRPGTEAAVQASSPLGYIVKDPRHINQPHTGHLRHDIGGQIRASETPEQGSRKRQKAMPSPPTTSRTRSVAAEPAFDSAWDPTDVLGNYSMQVAHNLYSSPCFRGKRPHERYESFCSTLSKHWSDLMATQSVSESPTLQAQQSSNWQQQTATTMRPHSPETLVREVNVSDSSGESDEEEVPHVTHNHFSSPLDYTADQMRVLEAYTRNRRTAKHKSVKRPSKKPENLTGKFLPCLQVGCKALFDDRSRWDRHLQQIIVKESWLCTMCFDQGTHHVELRAERLKNHLLKEHHVATVREAWIIAQKYKPYVPPFQATCGICSHDLFDNRAEWIDHVHKHCIEAEDSLALKAKWNDSVEFPPKFPDATVKRSRSACGNGVTTSKSKDQDGPDKDNGNSGQPPGPSSSKTPGANGRGQRKQQQRTTRGSQRTQNQGRTSQRQCNTMSPPKQKQLQKAGAGLEKPVRIRASKAPRAQDDAAHSGNDTELEVLTRSLGSCWIDEDTANCKFVHSQLLNRPEVSPQRPRKLSLSNKLGVCSIVSGYTSHAEQSTAVTYLQTLIASNLADPTSQLDPDASVRGMATFSFFADEIHLRGDIYGDDEKRPRWSGWSGLHDKLGMLNDPDFEYVHQWLLERDMRRDGALRAAWASYLRDRHRSCLCLGGGSAKTTSEQQSSLVRWRGPHTCGRNGSVYRRTETLWTQRHSSRVVESCS